MLGYGNRIEYVWQQNAGPSVARNTGAMYARNEWVAFLDSDDYWTPLHLARMAKAIEKTGGHARFYFSDMQMGKDNQCNPLADDKFRSAGSSPLDKGWHELGFPTTTALHATMLGISQRCLD